MHHDNNLLSRASPQITLAALAPIIITSRCHCVLFHRRSHGRINSFHRVLTRVYHHLLCVWIANLASLGWFLLFKCFDIHVLRRCQFVRRLCLIFFFGSSFFGTFRRVLQGDFIPTWIDLEDFPWFD